MANKVSIFIETVDGRHFELTNSKMSLMIIKDYPQINWDHIFNGDYSPYDIVLSDFRNTTKSLFGLGYYRIHRCDNIEDAKYIVSLCREKLKKQYERMMEIRVAKKYKLNSYVLSKIELEYHSPENYEVKLSDISVEKMLKEKGEEEE